MLVTRRRIQKRQQEEAAIVGRALSPEVNVRELLSLDQLAQFSRLVDDVLVDRDVIEIYQNSPTLRQLRDPDLLLGKCGACEYRQLCGGSRARAYAMTGDMLDWDGTCAYVPRGYEQPFERDRLEREARMGRLPLAVVNG